MASSSGRVVDPANTYNAAPYDTTATQSTFCLKCHSGTSTLPAYASSLSAYVPASVVVSQAQAAVMDKSAYGARGHWSAGGSIATSETVSCAVCHDRHGSQFPALLGTYDVATSTNRIRGVAIFGNDSTVCLACHTAGSANLAAPSRDASGYPTDGTWTGSAVFSGPTGIHRGASVTWPGSGYPGGDCKNCHDVHGTANTYDALVSTTTADSYSASTFALCFNCHDGAPSARDISRYYPTDASGTATQTSTTRYGHRTETTGTLPAGSALPCYDCHNPHGSEETTYGLMVTTMSDSTTTLVLGDSIGELDVGSPEGVRAFCLSCHTTAGWAWPNTDAYGWNGVGYAIVGAGALVEGIDRTIYDVAEKRGLKLTDYAGHYGSDVTSCYDCHGGSYLSEISNNVHNPAPGN
jgi:hypothetical protein